MDRRLAQWPSADGVHSLLVDSNTIQIRDLAKRYRNGVTANDAIDLDVPAGSIIGLLGPNGAGKTTLVRQVTGELLPTRGTITVAGIDVVRYPMRAKRLMGIVPQEAGTFDLLRVGEHLLIFGRLHGLSRTAARERTEQVLRDLDLVSHRSRTTMHLSGGLRRKLLFGMALLGKPLILVLDEPTTGLDPNSRREVWAIISSLREQGATVLLTTHYMEEAEALCSQVAIIGGGRILASGSIADVRSLCRNRFKAIYEQHGQSHTLYGETRAQVLAEVARLDPDESSLPNTRLEDIYVELTSRSPEATRDQARK
jgi:ABC-2 type transport system ATP-binding protein